MIQESIAGKVFSEKFYRQDIVQHKKTFLYSKMFITKLA